MTDFRNDYAALAAADRSIAETTILVNVREKYLKSAECWDRLEAAELELRSPRSASVDQHLLKGK